jgi:hypothetical protein
MSGAESLYLDAHGEAGEVPSPSIELASAEEEAAEKAEVFAPANSSGNPQETDTQAEAPLSRTQKQERMKRALAKIAESAPLLNEKPKTAGERHAEWVDMQTMEAIDSRLGSRIDLLIKKLDKGGRLNDEKPELQKFRIARTDKNEPLFDLLKREGYIITEGEEDSKVHYLDPAGYIAAKILIDPSLADSDKRLLIEGSKRPAEKLIAGKIQQIKVRHLME